MTEFQVLDRGFQKIYYNKLLSFIALINLVIPIPPPHLLKEVKFKEFI